MSWNSVRATLVGLQILVPTATRAAPTPASEPSIGLRWSDPSSLAPATQQDFDTQLAARLGRPIFVSGPHQPSLSVAWRGTTERCRVELSLAGAEGFEGTRVIDSPSGDCRALLPALLTVTALLVESYETARTAEPALPPPPPTAAPVVSAPPPAAAPPAAPPSRSEALALLSVGGALSYGFAPKLEIGLAVGAAWAPLRYVRLGLGGSLFVGHDYYGDGPGLSLDHQRASLLVCGMPLSGNLSLGLCGNLGLHRFDVRGTSLPHPDSDRLVSWSVGAEVRAEWRLTRKLWWVGQAGADLPTKPLYFFYTTSGGEPRNLFEQRRINPVLLVALSLEVP